MHRFSSIKTNFFVSQERTRQTFRAIRLYYVNQLGPLWRDFLSFFQRNPRSRPVEGKDKENISSGENRAVGEDSGLNIDEVEIYSRKPESSLLLFRFLDSNGVLHEKAISGGRKWLFRQVFPEKF